MSNNNQTQTKDLTVRYMIGETEVKLSPKIVQDFIIGTDSTITMPEFKFFTELCKARKLNPFLKEVYCIKYGNNPAQIVVGKDVFLKRAIQHPMFDGLESGVIVVDANSNLVERKGCFYLPTDTIVGGWAKVYRKDWGHCTYCSVSFEEVAQKKGNGELNSNWANKKATMVEKVAKVRALRETFVDDLAGMYDADEFQEPVIENKQSDVVEVEAEVIEQNEPTETEQVEAEQQQTISFAEL